MKDRRLIIMPFVLILFILMPLQANAAGPRWNMGSVVNAGKDNGYSKSEPIKSDDPHYNWTLGQFYIEGYSGKIVDEKGTPIFLKNVGDEVKLMFDLQQDINCLNDNEKLYICEDTNGYMEKYGIEKTNLMKGTLLIRHTDYQNKEGESQIYVDYLSAKNSEGADTQVLICEEGDYEVCLLYEVKSDNFLFFDGSSNYKIEFVFSVRNGNSMVFPFDIVTGKELTNSSFTEHGFRLDLANSHYLTIQVKREVWTKGTNEWVKDVRFNRVASDETSYTDEGIYTITVTNEYTDATTEKIVYVGTDSLLKAHIVTGLSLEEIESHIAAGATIDEGGNIVQLVVSEPLVLDNYEEPAKIVVQDKTEPTITENTIEDEVDILFAIVVFGIVSISIILIVLQKNRR